MKLNDIKKLQNGNKTDTKVLYTENKLVNLCQKSRK